jgi:hypothetical protein
MPSRRRASRAIKTRETANAIPAIRAAGKSMLRGSIRAERRRNSNVESESPPAVSDKMDIVRDCVVTATPIPIIRGDLRVPRILQGSRKVSQ